MNKDEVWKVLQSSKKNFLLNDLHTILNKQLEYNLDYYFEPAEADTMNRLIYLNNNLLIYFIFDDDSYEISYHKLNKLISVYKSSKGQVRINFQNEIIQSNPIFFKFNLLKNSLDSLFENLLQKLSE